ncbi:hypothetical protein EJ04DRAFT_487591 [Polyplosphaeria fusca]|uniref:LicD/FKTN/FKRP nucleotidyltransferase domain-containing protein n=1 Tax=Polyplosphaeria fusca TaxID=682080 RepID=A0A9P4R2T3_9PLEO|nr:hypothetical protein EJ04DRAFT_487591 [Polyplosphaeria fusca]
MHLLSLNFIILLLTCSQGSHALPTPAKRDVDFEDLYGLTKNLFDRSGKAFDPPEKYFHEATVRLHFSSQPEPAAPLHTLSQPSLLEPNHAQFHPHYDGRFASDILSSSLRRAHLIPLIQTYLSTMHALGAETWLMHGSLLGWYWNQRILPWDSDADVMVSHSSMHFLASYHNMTMHHYNVGSTPREREAGRTYLLEVNPHWSNGDERDTENVIDARWIDTTSGLFIDITTLRAAAQPSPPGAMVVKDRHHYLREHIFPLRESVFEGVPARVPFAYNALLSEEYGADCLVTSTFEGHHFDHKVGKWVPLPYVGSSNRGPTVMTEVPGDEFRGRPQQESGGPERARRPHRLSAGKVGDKHTVPGSSMDDFSLKFEA